MANQTPDRPPGMPTWLKVGVLVAAVVVLVIAVLALVLGVDHGPGRH